MTAIAYCFVFLYSLLLASVFNVVGLTGAGRGVNHQAAVALPGVRTDAIGWGAHPGCFVCRAKKEDAKGCRGAHLPPFTL